jgi:hypothetical protein
MKKLITRIKSVETLGEAIRSGGACIPITALTDGDERIRIFDFGTLVVEGDDSELRLRSGPLISEVEIFDSLDYFCDSRRFIPALNCVLDGFLNVVVKNATISSSAPSANHGHSNHFEYDTILVSDGECKNEKASDIVMVSKIARSKLNFDNLQRIVKTECSLDGELGTTFDRFGFGGDIPPYRYTIKQDESDLLIVVKLLSGGSSESEDSDRMFMEALILCFNWINGGHPYTYYRSHHRDEFLVEGVIQPLQLLPRSSPRLVRPKVGEASAKSIMECGIRFFSAKSPLSKDLELFLWQYQDATAEGPITLGMLLQGCTLLEGVVGLTLRHSIGLGSSAIDRLRMPGAAADPKRKSSAKEKYFHAGCHLGFDWDTEFEPAFKTWNAIRNSLAHGNIAEFENNNGDSMLESYRQVIQAFNSVTLRLIGYKGPVTMGKGWYAVP